jgi:hypothetical protein
VGLTEPSPIACKQRLASLVPSGNLLRCCKTSRAEGVGTGVVCGGPLQGLGCAVGRRRASSGRKSIVRVSIPPSKVATASPIIA